jgi:hypothetical protein
MKRTVYITILGLIIIFFASCAKPNEVPDVTETNVLSIEHFYPTVGYVYDIFATDSLLYVAEDQGGVSILNYNTNTEESRIQDDIDNARIIVGAEDINMLLVYDIYGDPGQIRVYDIEQRINPQILAPITGRTGDIEDIGYKVNDNNSLTVYWTRENFYNDGIYATSWNPFNLNLVLPNRARSFDYDEDYLYIAAEQSGIYVFELASLQTVLTFDTQGSALDVKKVDDYIFVANRQEGFSVFNVVDIMNPVLVYSKNLGELIYTVEIENNIMALTSHSGGVYVYDITNATEPELLGNLDDELGYTYKSVIKNGKVFAGTRTGVFEISIDQQ